MDTATRPFWAIKYGTDSKYKGYNRLTVCGYIGIGWTYAGDLTTAHTSDAIRNVLRETMPEDISRNLNHDVPILHAFINEVQEDDFIACHDQEDGYVYIGQFKGPCLYDTSLHQHLHLLRKVEWINPLRPGLVLDSAKTLTNRGTFWKVGEPSNLVEAYRTYGRFKMRVSTTGE